MEKRIDIKERNLYLPVWKETDTACLEIFRIRNESEEKLFELLLPRGGSCSRPDYFAALPVGEYMGETLICRGDFPESFDRAITQDARLQAGQKRLARPEIHFTPGTGWINDPNGLVMQDGVYHLYFQYNPFDTRWNNMSWGHAVSRDLLCWEQKDTVLLPDEHGTVFSGCALVNERGLLGLPREALLYFYTAAGGANTWSEGKRFTQRIAYSLDGGMTLRKLDRGALPTICAENRDPKIFWHEESGAYIMVLWLEGNDFGILRSADLESWEQTQTLTLEKAFECPDLLRLPDGQGREGWVFWCADGYYFWGEFDGYLFRQEGPRQQAYMNGLPYAAQTYSGVRGRTIQVPWLRLNNMGDDYTGAMGIPRELSVHVTRDGEKRLRQQPVRELWSWEGPEGKKLLVEELADEAGEIRSRWIIAGCRDGSQPVTCMRQEESCIWSIGEKRIVYHFASGELRAGGEICSLTPGIRDFSFILDGNILEVGADCDTIVGMFVI